MTGVFQREALATGKTPEFVKQQEVSRAALRRMVTEGEIAAAVISMLHMPGMCGADIDLSAGMVAR